MSSLQPVSAVADPYVVTEIRSWYQCRLLDGQPPAFFAAFCQEYTTLLRQFDQTARPFTVRALTAIVKQSSEIWCQVWCEGELVGSLQGALSWPRGVGMVTLTDLVVDRLHRDQGIEWLLWRQWRAIMIQRRPVLPTPRCVTVLYGDRGDQAALYQALGFTTTNLVTLERNLLPGP